jgi:two-component system LytT family response regulator
MDKIRAIIADDEPLARRGIVQMLTPYNDITVVGEARNGREAVRALRDLKPDLLFLDVQMPEMDGFGVLREIDAKHMPAVIFVTAYDEYAVRAFEADALDYLVKPIEAARFAQTLDRTRERLRLARAKQRLLVPVASGEILLDISEIDRIEAADYYASIHTRKASHLIRESLASLERRLDARRFVRVHRSTIVNIDEVREIRRKDREIVLLLNSGAHIPVSRRRADQVTRMFRSTARCMDPTDR